MDTVGLYAVGGKIYLMLSGPIYEYANFIVFVAMRSVGFMGISAVAYRFPLYLIQLKCLLLRTGWHFVGFDGV